MAPHYSKLCRTKKAFSQKEATCSKKSWQKSTFCNRIWQWLSGLPYPLWYLWPRVGYIIKQRVYMKNIGTVLPEYIVYCYESFRSCLSYSRSRRTEKRQRTVLLFHSISLVVLIVIVLLGYYGLKMFAMNAVSQSMMKSRSTWSQLGWRKLKIL